MFAEFLDGDEVRSEAEQSEAEHSNSTRPKILFAEDRRSEAKI